MGVMGYKYLKKYLYPVFFNPSVIYQLNGVNRIIMEYFLNVKTALILHMWPLFINELFIFVHPNFSNSFVILNLSL